MPVFWPKLVKLAPLNVKLLSTERPPLTTIVGPPRVLDSSCGAETVVTPGKIFARSITFRPLRGRSWTRRSSTRAERVWLVVLTRTPWLDTVISDCTAPRGLVSGIDQDPLARYRDFRLHGAHLNLHIETQSLPLGEADAGLSLPFKPGALGADLVDAGRHGQQVVVSGFIRLGRARELLLHGNGFDGCVSHIGAGRILDVSIDPPGDLGMEGGTDPQKTCCQRQRMRTAAFR